MQQMNDWVVPCAACMGCSSYSHRILYLAGQLIDVNFDRDSVSPVHTSLYLWLKSAGAQLSSAATEHSMSIDLFNVPETQTANSVDKWHLNTRLDHQLYACRLSNETKEEWVAFNVFTKITSYHSI
jgi:hypothetical protein